MTRTGAIEKARLRELYRYRIVDTPPEPEFDGLCELAELAAWVRAYPAPRPPR